MLLRICFVYFYFFSFFFFVVAGATRSIRMASVLRGASPKKREEEEKKRGDALRNPIERTKVKLLNDLMVLMVSCFGVAFYNVGLPLAPYKEKNNLRG